MDTFETLSAPTVLLVESEDSLRRVISVSISELNIRVLEAVDLESAMDLLKNESPDVLIIEYDFPFGHNGELIETFRRSEENQEGYVIVTTTNRIANPWRYKYGPDAILYKPFDIRGLFKTVKSLIGKSRAKHDCSITTDGMKG
jgi:DNA-binding response OmpR family regulator